MDIERFKALSSDDRAGLRELLELYVRKTAEQVRELEAAIARANPADIARVAHSMVGANAMVGMTSLVPLLRRLEEHGEHGDVPSAGRAMQDVTAEFLRIRAFLEQQIVSLP